MLGVRLEGRCQAQAVERAFQPNLWVRLEKDGRVVLTVGKSEMGQGVRTSLPMILCEELGADWSKVQVEQAMPGPDFRGLGTGGSTSVRGSWRPLRLAGAAARHMLCAAAAARWGVPPQSCDTRDGWVVSGDRRLPFGDLVEAAAALEVPKEPTLRAGKGVGILGKDRKRMDGPAIVTGQPLFGLDQRLPGQRFAVLLRCPVPGGQVRASNASEVARMAGVVGIHSVGRGLAIVAETTHHAMAARKALKVQWDPGPGASFSTEAFRQELAGLVGKSGQEVARRGEPEGALVASSRRIDALYEFPFQSHATMEPPNALAKVSADGCEVWAGTQSPNDAHSRLQKLLNLKPEQVKVHVTLLGGGFGRRLSSEYILEAAEVAKAAGVPILLVWDREEDLHFDRHHPMSVHRLEAGLDARGQVVAWTHRVAAPSILLSWSEGRRSPGIAAAETNGARQIPYDIPTHRVDYVEAACPRELGWWRAIQVVPNVFARECFVDELAHAAQQDPLAFRLSLLPGGKLKSGGEDIDTGRLKAVLVAAAKKAGWGKPLPKGRALGIACCYDCETYLAEVVEVSLDKRKLRVHRVTAAVDPGVVINPIGLKNQVEGGIAFGLSALRSAITIKEGVVEQSNLVDFPILRMGGMPRIETVILQGGGNPGGMGEPPVPPCLPAVLNAYFALTGKRVRRLPFED